MQRDNRENQIVSTLVGCLVKYVKKFKLLIRNLNKFITINFCFSFYYKIYTTNLFQYIQIEFLCRIAQLLTKFVQSKLDKSGEKIRKFRTKAPALWNSVSLLWLWWWRWCHGWRWRCWWQDEYSLLMLPASALMLFRPTVAPARPCRVPREVREFIAPALELAVVPDVR